MQFANVLYVQRLNTYKHIYKYTATDCNNLRPTKLAQFGRLVTQQKKKQLSEMGYFGDGCLTADRRPA